MTIDRMLLATSNPGKRREVLAVLSDLPLQIEILTDYPGLPDVEENADTFEGNAERKAVHYAAATGRWTLADDSGLEVDALGGAPGIRSARFAGPARDDAANNAKLLTELAKAPFAPRTARFRCAVTLAGPSGPLATATGTIEGMILDNPRGSNGFGYDPLFLVPELVLTLAEMDAETKNRISHRGRALRIIRAHIERLIAADAPHGPTART